LRAWDAHLPELVRRSLVDRRERPDTHDRFWLHPVWREYVRGKAGPEAMTAHDRQMARYFLALADWDMTNLAIPKPRCKQCRWRRLSKPTCALRRKSAWRKRCGKKPSHSPTGWTISLSAVAIGRCGGGHWKPASRRHSTAKTRATKPGWCTIWLTWTKTKATTLPHVTSTPKASKSTGGSATRPESPTRLVNWVT